MHYNNIHQTPLQVGKWKDKFCAANQELKLLQVRILAKSKAVFFFSLSMHVLTSVWISPPIPLYIKDKMTKIEDNFKKAREF